MFICFGVWASFFVFWQKVRVTKKQPNITEKNWGKKFVEKLFLNSLSDLEQKVWTIRQKILAALSKLVQSVQGNNFRTFLSNAETLLKFCGRLSFWTFGLKFLSNFSKLQPTGAAESFNVFFRREEYLFDRFQSLSQKNRLLAWNIWHLAVLLKVHFTCPQQKCTEGKNVKKILLKNWFFVFFWNLTRKNCIFTGKFFAGLSKLLSTFPEEHLRRNFRKEVLKT